ncbi:anti-anti-sigma factor [Micromonosporaceae bacterium Da 78-11]
MPSEVRHLVDRGNSYPLVRFTGVLDAATAPVVRSALLSVLAGQPEAVVADVTDLRVVEPRAVDVLADVRRETADWPAAHLVLCDAGDSDVWSGVGWPVWTHSADAFAELGEPEVGRRLTRTLDPVVGAARRTRELITEACSSWERPDLAGPACIVATELVNNVVAHAHTEMIVLLAAHGAGMSVAVRDQSPVVPSFTGDAPAPTVYGGRGMLLIDSMASRWGHLALDDGKVVWALLESDEEPAPARPRHRNGAGMTDPARG